VLELILQQHLYGFGPTMKRQGSLEACVATGRFYEQHTDKLRNPTMNQATSMIFTYDKKYLQKKAQWVREVVVDMSVKAKGGHVTTAFSQAEMLVALYHGRILRLKPDQPKWPERDRFILSKGQGGIGAYPVLADMGFFPVEELEEFAQEGSRLGVHAEWNVPGIELLTGSLGHGLPLATGMALDAQLKRKKHLIFVMLGDGELHEGSNWEAMFFASHYRMDNLVCVVDRNQQSVLGFHDSNSEFLDPNYHKDGPCLNPLEDKWKAFGFEVRVIQDGHDFDQIFPAFEGVYERPGKAGKPLVIIGETSKGRGSRITQDQRLWHYRVPGGTDLKQIREDIAMGLEAFDAEMAKLKTATKQSEAQEAEVSKTMGY
jgi:transketolase